MSEPAKDEAELMERVVATLWRYQGAHHAEIAFAAIRAAGWAVVPQTKLDCLRADNALLLASFMEKAAEELEKVYDMYCSNHHQYERDMELPRAIRAMLAAAPGMKP
jgi:hypothetical protein